MPGQDAGQQAGRIAPDVVVRIVLDELEAAERERTAIGIAEEQPVEHASAARAGGGREQRELAVLGLEAATELRKSTVPRPRAARGPRWKRSKSSISTSNLAEQRLWARRPAAGPVVVAHLEREPAPHALVEVQIRVAAEPVTAPARDPLRHPVGEGRDREAQGSRRAGPGIAAPSAT